ncbi:MULTISPECIES: NUDIX domain-containing protein [unclassified Schlesneria]|uniref:NUDIX domain-containing protein n=1 Tax=Schlesneria TaxID=656899 RepID=UPI00359FD573
MTTAKRIGIAVVEHHSRYLVGIRGPGSVLEGYAEFPGGKCEEDESPIECAVRECFEESGLVVIPERLLQRRQFEYPHGRVELYFVLCHPVGLVDALAQHQGFRWETLDDLRLLNFPEGNSEVLNLLS